MRWIITAFLLVLWSVPVSAATLNWVDTNTRELGTLIERSDTTCMSASIWSQIGEVAPDITDYVDPTPQPGYRYCYRVRVYAKQFVDGSGEIVYSPYSNLAGYDYPLPALAAPGQLGAAPGQ